MAYQLSGCVNSVALVRRRAPVLGNRDMGWARQRVSIEHAQGRWETRVHTQHRALLILNAPLLPDVVGNPQEEDSILVGAELARVEPPDDGKASAVVDLVGNAGKLCLNGRKREVVACHGIEAEPALWILSVRRPQTRREDTMRLD
jgi:hypothetical protein